MSHPTLDEFNECLKRVKAVFTGVKLESIKIIMEDNSMAFYNFSDEELEQKTSFEPLPAGDYLAQVCNNEWKATEKGGHYLNLTFEVVDGDCKGKKFFDKLNLDNGNITAVKIAMQSLKAICNAVNADDYFAAIRGADTLAEVEGLLEQIPEALYGSPILVKLAVEEDKGYGEQNKVKGYFPPPPVTNSKSAPAWAKGK